MESWFDRYFLGRYGKQRFLYDFRRPIDSGVNRTRLASVSCADPASTTVTPEVHFEMGWITPYEAAVAMFGRRA